MNMSNRGRNVIAGLPATPADFHSRMLPQLKREIGHLLDTDDALALPAELQLPSAVYEIRVQLHPSLRLVVERTGDRLAESLQRIAEAHARYRGLAGRFVVALETAPSAAGPAFVLLLSSGFTATEDGRRATKMSRRTDPVRIPIAAPLRAPAMHRLTEETIDLRTAPTYVTGARNTRPVGDTRLDEHLDAAGRFDPRAYELEIASAEGRSVVPVDVPLLTIGRSSIEGGQASEARIRLPALDTVSRRQVAIRWLGTDSISFEVLNIGLNAIRLGDDLVPGAAAGDSVDLDSLDPRHRRPLAVGNAVRLPGDLVLRLREAEGHSVAFDSPPPPEHRAADVGVNLSGA